MKVKILTSQNKYSMGYVGEIAVKSAEGKGTAFTISLPVS